MANRVRHRQRSPTPLAVYRKRWTKHRKKWIGTATAAPPVTPNRRRWAAHV